MPWFAWVPRRTPTSLVHGAVAEAKQIDVVVAVTYVEKQVVIPRAERDATLVARWLERKGPRGEQLPRRGIPHEQSMMTANVTITSV